MDASVQERFAPANGPENGFRVLAAGAEGFRRDVAKALDAADGVLVDTAATPDGVMERVVFGPVDCIVVDTTVSGTNSVELLERIARRLRSPPAMVLLTDQVDARTVLNAFRAGFNDCVQRADDCAAELRTAVKRSVERARRIRQLNDEVDYHARLAKSDRLTGLPNRAALQERMASLIASAERHGGEFAMLLIDIDNFRQINDIHGHTVGDRALRAFGRRLVLTSRASDTFGRFGADEFLYLIERAVTQETVAMIGARLVKALAFAMDVEPIGLSLSASIGASIFPSDAATPAALIAAANRALAVARQRAHRCCLAYEATMTPAEDRTNQPAALAQTETRIEDRRAEHRSRVLKRGRLIFGDGFSTMDCVVRNLSQHGARVSLDNYATVPDRFALWIVDTGTTYTAVRRWQRGTSIGIEFSGHADADHRSHQVPEKEPPG